MKRCFGWARVEMESREPLPFKDSHRGSPTAVIRPFKPKNLLRPLRRGRRLFFSSRFWASRCPRQADQGIQRLLAQPDAAGPRFV